MKIQGLYVETNQYPGDWGRNSQHPVLYLQAWCKNLKTLSFMKLQTVQADILCLNKTQWANAKPKINVGCKRLKKFDDVFFLICLCFEPGVFLGLKTSVVDYFPPSPDFWQMVHHFHLSSPLTSAGIVFLINSEHKLESRERWFLYSGLRLIFLLGSELLNSGRADRPSGSGETATWKHDGGCHHF